MQKAIEIINLSYFYPDKHKALDNISLDVYEGDCVGIIGPNGAGKSTLFLHLNGILKGSGIIKIFGRQINNDTLFEIRKDVGLIFQDPDNQLFMPTVFDDVAFGPINMSLKTDEVYSAVNTALKEVDMQDAINRSSHHLSFGEKKRISFATVLSMNPGILALDEPTSNLDPKHRKDLINLLKKINATKIIATHDLELVRELCTKTMLLNKGKVIEIAATEDILNNQKLLEHCGLC